MVSSLELSIVVWSRYISLKLLRRIRESDVKEASLFHSFLQIFYKNVYEYLKSASILIVCHSKKTKSSITFTLDVMLTCGFF